MSSAATDIVLEFLFELVTTIAEGIENLELGLHLCAISIRRFDTGEMLTFPVYHDPIAGMKDRLIELVEIPETVNGSAENRLGDPEVDFSDNASTDSARATAASVARFSGLAISSSK